MHTPSLPATGFLRITDIVGDPRRPERGRIIPVSRSTWWAGVKEGRFPKPVKLGPRTTAWRAEDLRAYIARTGEVAA